jgi:hypothetical protein
MYLDNQNALQFEMEGVVDSSCMYMLLVKTFNLIELPALVKASMSLVFNCDVSVLRLVKVSFLFLALNLCSGLNGHLNGFGPMPTHRCGMSVC